MDFNDFHAIILFYFLGKITVYLGRRDFIDNTQVTEPVDGVVLIDNDYTRGRKIFAAVSIKIYFLKFANLAPTLPLYKILDKAQ